MSNLSARVFRIEIVDKYGARRTKTLLAKTKKEAMLIVSKALSPDVEFVGKCEEVQL